MLKIYFINILFGLACLAAGNSAQEKWNSAVSFIENAEAKVRKAKHDEAVVILNAALRDLNDLRYNSPSWNSSAVRNKMTNVKKRIIEIEELIISSYINLDRKTLLEKLKETQVREVLEAAESEKKVC